MYKKRDLHKIRNLTPDDMIIYKHNLNNHEEKYIILGYQGDGYYRTFNIVHKIYFRGYFFVSSLEDYSTLVIRKK